MEEDSEAGEDISVDDIGETSLEARRLSIRSKRRSFSRHSIEEPLISRRVSGSSYPQDRTTDSRLNQKIYIASEDLTVVFAGFTTSTIGLIVYVTLCIFTLGSAYLLFRWLPRLRVRLVGKPTPLRKCKWVAVEVRIPWMSKKDELPLAHNFQDQWNQFATYEVASQPYGRPISTVFADPQCYLYDEDNDPAMSFLRYVDYRYLHFFYHPLEDKFCLLNGWKDPAWTNVKVMRAGLDADDRDSREQIFGSNTVDIKQKSAPQLLVDEVSNCPL